jgi:hypothetical protein
MTDTGAMWAGGAGVGAGAGAGREGGAEEARAEAEEEAAEAEGGSLVHMGAMRYLGSIRQQLDTEVDFVVVDVILQTQVPYLYMYYVYYVYQTLSLYAHVYLNPSMHTCI